MNGIIVMLLGVCLAVIMYLLLMICNNQVELAKVLREILKELKDL